MEAADGTVADGMAVDGTGAGVVAGMAEVGVGAGGMAEVGGPDTGVLVILIGVILIGAGTAAVGVVAGVGVAVTGGVATEAGAAVTGVAVTGVSRSPVCRTFSLLPKVGLVARLRQGGAPCKRGLAKAEGRLREGLARMQGWDPASLPLGCERGSVSGDLIDAPANERANEANRCWAVLPKKSIDSSRCFPSLDSSCLNPTLS
jgi:hypothetical protein